MLYTKNATNKNTLVLFMGISLFIMVLIVSMPIASAANWPMFMHDLSNSGTTGETVEPPLGLLWTVAIRGPNLEGSSPIVSEGIVYVAGDINHLYAMNAENGVLIWKFKLADEKNDAIMMSSPAVSDGIVYASTSKYIYALDSKDGNLMWKYRTESDVILTPSTSYPHLSSPAISDDVVYVGSVDNYVYALYAQNGSLKWRFKTNSRVVSSPAISDDVVYIGSKENYFYALYANNGSLKWKYHTTGRVLTPIVDDKTVYVKSIGRRDGTLYAFDVNTGHVKWRNIMGARVVSSFGAISDGIIYDSGFKDDYGGPTQLSSLYAQNGSIKWKFTIDSNSGIFSTVVSGNVIYAGYDGEIYALDTESGNLKETYVAYTIDDIHGMYPPATSNNIMYVADEEKIHAFISIPYMTSLIQDANETLRGFESDSINVSRARQNLTKTELALKNGDYLQANHLFDENGNGYYLQAKTLTEQLINEVDIIKIEYNDAKEAILDAREAINTYQNNNPSSSDVSKKFETLSSADLALKNGNFSRAKKLAFEANPRYSYIATVKELTNKAKSMGLDVSKEVKILDMSDMSFGNKDEDQADKLAKDVEFEVVTKIAKELLKKRKSLEMDTSTALQKLSETEADFNNEVHSGRNAHDRYIDGFYDVINIMEAAESISIARKIIDEESEYADITYAEEILERSESDYGFGYYRHAKDSAMEATIMAQDVDHDGILNKDDRFPNSRSIQSIIVDVFFGFLIILIISAIKIKGIKRWDRKKI